MLWTTLRITVQVASTATAVALVPGVALAWVLARHRVPWLEAVVTLPLVLPPVAVGLVLLTLLSGVGLVFTWPAAAVASLIMSFPLLVRSVQQAMGAVPRRLEEMASTLGGTPWHVFWTVTLPLSRRGIVNGLLLTFARSLGEFGATILVAGNIPGSTQTLATGIYSAVINGHDPEAWLLASVAATLALAATVCANVLSRD